MDDLLKNIISSQLNDAFGDQFKNFEQFIRDMESSLNRNFISDEQINHELPSVNDSKSSLRDKYLKKFEETPREDLPVPILPRSIFDKFFDSAPVFSEKFKPNVPDPNFDENLDAKIMQDPNILKRYERNQVNEPNLFSNNRNFSSKSYSISRIQRPDGSIEEKHITRDSNGMEEHVTTRIKDDKSYSIVESIRPDGSKETREVFNNFDADKLDEFNKNWAKPSDENYFHRHSILDNPAIPIDNSPSQSQSQRQHLSDFEQKHPFLSKIFSWLK